jgi:glucosamine--fructose-6-phosphate aminotransferase (isomerizing)
VTGFYDDLYEQPVAIRQTVEALQKQLKPISAFAAKLQSGEIERVIFTGMGGSFAAGTLGQLALIRNGIMALAVEASELIVDYTSFITSKTLIVAISQSGRSIEIVRLLDLLHSLSDPAPLIGITNTVGSPLETHSTYAIVTQAGEEESVSTKTYTCALAALHLLSSILLGQSPEVATNNLLRAADVIETRIPVWRQQTTEIAEQLFTTTQFVEFVGRGAARASALTGALITKETAKLPTEGMVGGQFRHGPIEVVDEKVAVIIFMGTGSAHELNEALARDLIARGCHVIAIGAGVTGSTAISIPVLDDEIMALVDIVPVQLLAAALASLRGFTPGKFRYSSKVTTTE